jgi:quinol monooxygenase YgiN
MNDQQITVIAHLEVRPGTEEEFKQHLPALVTATRAEAACLSYDFHQAPDEPTKFVAYETWASRAGLDEHARSAHLQTFRRNCAELFAQPVRVTIWKKLEL